MFCYSCGCRLAEQDYCTACGVDVSLYKKVIHVSNMYYNEGLEKAGVRDLAGAAVSLRKSLTFNKHNIRARNLLGLVYFEMGEVVSAIQEWVISKNMRPNKNIAGEYIDKVQSNAGRLESINQTIKKYNRALTLCNQGSKDLAVIQLKKVLSMNPRFVSARQLLALLYMDGQDWERAERELQKCREIDRNNTQTLYYLKEVEQMMAPEEGVRPSAKRRKEEAVRYQSDNEIIIQPLNVKEPKGGGLSALLNIVIGLVIGIAATYFLVVRAAEAKVRNEDQQIITRISSESDAKTARIQELESQIAGMEESTKEIQAQLEDYVGVDGTLQNTEILLNALAAYMETEDRTAAASAAAAELDAISQRVNLEEMTDGFKRLYQAASGTILPEVAGIYMEEGNRLYNARNYGEAAVAFEQAFAYDAGNEEALYQIGQCYRFVGENEKALAAYDKVIELFPESWRAERSQEYRPLVGGN